MDISTLSYFLMIGGFVVNKNCEGISHEESLIDPKGGAHCANWVMGHMVRTRNEILELLGKKPLYPEDKFAAYSPREFSPDKAVPIQELQRSFNELQIPLEEGLRSLTPEQLQKPASVSPTKNPSETVGSLLAAIFWHEAYHAGQIGIIRRTVGKPGVIKNPDGE